MKRIGCFLVLMLLLCGCQKTEPIEEETTKGSVVELTPQEVIDKIDAEESFFLFVSLTTCPVCAEYKNVIQEMIANYQVTIYHLEVDLYTEEEMEVVSEQYLDHLTDAPDTFAFQNGKLVYEKVGIILYRNLKELLVDYEYLN